MHGQGGCLGSGAGGGNIVHQNDAVKFLKLEALGKSNGEDVLNGSGPCVNVQRGEFGGSTRAAQNRNELNLLVRLVLRPDSL